MYEDPTNNLGEGTAILDCVLRQSQDLAFATDAAGHCLAFRLAAPAQCVRLSALDQLLLACFNPESAIPVRQALREVARQFSRFHESTDDWAVAAVARLVEEGALVPVAAQNGPYTREMVHYYVRHRPVPPDVCNKIVAEGQVVNSTTVLDVGCGPGAIALRLADFSAHVIGIDINQDFRTCC